MRARLGIDTGDERFREKAKRTIAAALSSPDEKLRVGAAKSIYSYGPTRAPDDEAELRKHDAGPMRISLVDLITTATEAGVITQLPALEAAIRAAYHKLPPEAEPPEAAA